jgi:rhamnosyltransferase
MATLNEHDRSVERVFAIVVSFHPDTSRLRQLLRATLPQVEHVCVVDNSLGVDLQGAIGDLPRVSVLPLGTNRGVGAAQNIGVQAAIAAGADHVLLLDQDSLPAQDMVERQLDAASMLKRLGHQLAAVGPSTPSRGAPGTFARIAWFRYRQVAFRAGDPYVWTDLLIASGMLISTAAWSSVGPMDDTLFVDKVDTEWCIRAAHRGFRLAGVPSAVLDHSLGESAIAFWLGRWRHVPVHRPFRYYYMIRNGVLIARRPYASWRWRTADTRLSISMLIFFALFSSQRRATLRMMFRGLIDGIKGTVGPMDSGVQDARASGLQ